MQISDIHLNYFHDELRIRDFRTFANEAINAIKPPVVIASGDLTDGKGRDFFSSKQNDEEWKTYREILDSANVQNKTKWLDLRGNHGELRVISRDIFLRVKCVPIQIGAHFLLGVGANAHITMRRIVSAGGPVQSKVR